MTEYPFGCEQGHFQCDRDIFLHKLIHLISKAILSATGFVHGLACVIPRNFHVKNALIKLFEERKTRTEAMLVPY